MREGTSSRRRGDHVGCRGPASGHAPAYGLPSGEQGLSPVGHCTSPSISIQMRNRLKPPPTRPSSS
jgi:hypothetical protein